MSNELAVSNQSVANKVPGMEWLYQGGGARVSINNKTRNGFVFKNSGEEVAELNAVITNVKSLHSHRQPDPKRPDPRHASPNDWCQSYDNKKTNDTGGSCAGCPAYANCAWKLELEMSIAGREEGTFLMTIPTVSSMRFKEAFTFLDKTYHKHLTEVVWSMKVEVVDKDGNVFPAIVFAARDPKTGEVLDGKVKEVPQIEEPGLIAELTKRANAYNRNPTEEQLQKMRGLLAGTLDELLGFKHKHNDFIAAVYPDSLGHIGGLPAKWVGGMLNWLALESKVENGNKVYVPSQQTDAAKLGMMEFWREYQKSKGQTELF